MRSLFPRRAVPLAAVLLVSALLLCGCGVAKKQAAGPVITLDGAAWNGETVQPEAQGLRVYVTLDGEKLIDLPFDSPHTLTVTQPGLGENTVQITGEAVYMAHADCENQDCVQMGQVTRDNLEMRVMGGFIVCLPHRLSVEVRGE